MDFLDFSGLQTFYNKLKNKFIWKVNNKTTSDGTVNLGANDVGAIALDGSTMNNLTVGADTLKTGLSAVSSSELVVSAVNNGTGVQIKIDGSSLYYRTGNNSSWSSSWTQIELGGIASITSSDQFSPGVVDSAALAADSVTAAAISNGVVGFSKLGDDILPEHVGIKSGSAAASSANLAIGQIYLQY